MGSKLWLIIISVIIVISGVAIGVLTVQRLAVKVELEKANTMIAELRGNLANADIAYRQQALLIEGLRLDNDNATIKLKSEKERIEVKYNKAVEDSKTAYSDNATCQTQLELIFNAQKEFLR